MISRVPTSSSGPRGDIAEQVFLFLFVCLLSLRQRRAPCVVTAGPESRTGTEAVLFAGWQNNSLIEWFILVATLLASTWNIAAADAVFIRCQACKTDL